jgi:hypothetical protein
LEFEYWANETTTEKLTVMKTSEPMREGHRGGQDPHRVIVSVEKKNEETS